MSCRLGMVSAAILISGIATLAGQAPPAQSRPARVAAGAAPAPAWVQPRTPDGQPDLQGFWSNSTYMPLERPERRHQGVLHARGGGRDPQDRRQRASRRRPSPGTVEDVHYDFSQFGLDRSQAAQAPNLRTSLIVDPPDGKIPPMTEEGTPARGRRAKPPPRASAAGTRPRATSSTIGA